MRQMKNSGIEWVGDIPENWNALKLKYVVKTRDEKALFAPNYDTYIGMENIKGYSNELIETDTEYEKSIQSVYKHGDILFGKLRPYLSKVCIMENSGFCSGEFLVVSDYNGCKSFLRYSLLNPKFIQNINASTYGAKMPRANSEYILNQKIAVPPIDEQERIAEFLDKKCGEIDGLIADIKTQVQTLELYKRSVITEAVTKGLNPSAEMRDSGIEWIGNVPAGWTINKIDSVYSLRNEKVSDKDYMPLSVTMKGIVPQLESAAKTNDGDNRKLVRKGDFAINSRSDRRGSCGISELDGSVSLINLVLKPRGEMNNRYYNWLFHTEKFADEFYKWGHGIVDDLWTTRWIDMRKISVPMPPLSEQKEIADYLDNKCAQIEELISAKQSQIETLESYKKSLIYEFVTGKKEVV